MGNHIVVSGRCLPERVKRGKSHPQRTEGSMLAALCLPELAIWLQIQVAASHPQVSAFHVQLSGM